MHVFVCRVCAYGMDVNGAPMCMCRLSNVEFTRLFDVVIYGMCSLSVCWWCRTFVRTNLRVIGTPAVENSVESVSEHIICPLMTWGFVGWCAASLCCQCVQHGVYFGCSKLHHCYRYCCHCCCCFWMMLLLLLLFMMNLCVFSCMPCIRKVSTIRRNNNNLLVVEMYYVRDEWVSMIFTPSLNRRIYDAHSAVCTLPLNRYQLLCIHSEMLKFT